MKMSISKKERDLLIGFFGVLIAVAVWFLVAKPNIDKIEALNAENVILKAQAEEYEAVNLRVPEYEAGIINNQILMANISEHYPGEIKLEDQIMFWATIDHAYPFQLAFGDLSLEDRDAVAVSGVEDTGNADITYNEDGSGTFKDSQIEEISAKYYLYGAPMAMEFACTYAGLKNMINYIVNQYDRNSIVALEVYYDENTGLLAGAIGIELYYIEGLEKEYQASFIPSVITGQDNIFRTGLGTVMNAVQAAAEATESENESEE